eukprot:scaffold91625_cov18-Tisochrysis_lutea.AAC.2
MKHQAVTAHMGSFNFQAMSELPEPARSKAAPPRPSPPFKVCYFFNTPAGCYKGGKCPFVHIKVRSDGCLKETVELYWSRSNV